MKNFNFTFVMLFAFHIAYSQSSSRLVLLEQFTNAGCPTCGIFTPQVMQYVADHSNQVITIAYHPEFPHFDSLYYENPVDVNTKVNYYGIQYAPTAILDGNQFQGSSPTLLQNIDTKVSNRAAVPPTYSIEFNQALIDGNQVSIGLNFTSLADHTGQNLRAMVAIVEETVLKSSYLSSPGGNSEQEYKYVMRKLLPDASGTVLDNLAQNGQDNVQLQWNLNKIKSVSEIRLIAFVQNMDTKEIMQSNITTPTISTGIDKIDKGFELSPNPSSGLVFINSKSIDKLLLKDIVGKEIEVPKGRNFIDISGLENGFYFLQVDNLIEKIIKN